MPGPIADNAAYRCTFGPRRANGLTEVIPPAEWSDMLTQLCLSESGSHTAAVSKVVVEEAERFASSLPGKITQEDLVQLLTYLPGERIAPVCG